MPVAQPASDAPTRKVDIVGPICEIDRSPGRAAGHAAGRGRRSVGDLSAGAYGAVMASTYNLRRLAPEVMVRGHEFAVVRQRPEYQAIMERDRLPGWLADDRSDALRAQATRGGPDRAAA